MELNQDQLLIIISIVIFIGVVASVGYYFARFSIRDQQEQARKQLEDAERTREASDLVGERAADIAHEAEHILEEAKESEEAADEAYQKTKELGEQAAQEKAEAEKARADLKVVPPQKDLYTAMERTRANLFGRIKDMFTGKTLTEEEMEDLEEVLYTSDLGPQTVQRLLSAIEDRLSSSERADIEKVREALRAEMLEIFSSVDGAVTEVPEEGDITQVIRKAHEGSKPQVWMIVGVNGAGKTTTIGKLSNGIAKAGLKVLVAAGDTFRAAAGDQLRVWTDRAQVEIFSPEGVKDPSAVAYDACESAKAKGFDVVIIDTAGRLHTQANLMEELKKMKRVVQKVIPEAPHEVLLVLDANSGQNALIQAKSFNEALDVSGVVLTKLDGSAKGGVAIGLAHELHIPIKLIGVGEGMEDLRPFKSDEFVHSIIG